MSLIAFLVVGLIAGLVARAITPGTQSMGLLATTAVGIAGSFVGGLVSSLLDSEGRWMDLHPSGIFFSVVGAVGVLLLVSAGRRSRG